MRSSCLAPGLRGAPGGRHVVFRDSRNQLWCTKLDDRSSSGLYADVEVLDVVASTSVELNLCPGLWEGKSGLPLSSVVACAKGLRFDYMWPFGRSDQLHGLKVVVIEMICCDRVIRSRHEVPQTPEAPDFPGAKRFLMTNFGEIGGSVATEFGKWMSARQRG